MQISFQQFFTQNEPVLLYFCATVLVVAIIFVVVQVFTGLRLWWRRHEL